MDTFAFQRPKIIKLLEVFEVPLLTYFAPKVHFVPKLLDLHMKFG